MVATLSQTVACGPRVGASLGAKSLLGAIRVVIVSLMETDIKRHMLRHFLATLAYRGTNILRNMPADISHYRPSPLVRTPVEILNHLNGVLTYAHSFLVPYESTEPSLLEWQREVDRFYEILTKLDETLAGQTPLLEINEEDLLQGPFADAMLHLGQIGIFRRMAGSPVAAENYVFADVMAGRLVRCNG